MRPELAEVTYLCSEGLIYGSPRSGGDAQNQCVIAVNVAFRGAAATTDPLCPYEQTDVSCDGFTNVIDVVKFVNVAFRGGECRHGVL